MYISIDIGGTKTRVASSLNLKSIHKSEKFPSADSLELQRENILTAVTKVADGDRVDGICMGVPGILDYDKRKFKMVPNYAMLRGVDFNYFFSADYAKAPVFFENDAALAGLGEAVLGSGKTYSSMAYLTLSTGVGGVLIEDKRIGIRPKSYEPGHQVIKFDSDRFDNSGIRGSAEAYLSGIAFEKIYGMKPELCDNQVIWDEYGKILSYLIINLTSMWNPDVVVLGGSLVNKFESFSEPLGRELEKITLFKIPPVLKTTFEDDSGLIGGLEFLRQSVHFD